MAELELVNLKKSYALFAMTDVSLALKQGQILCLLGPSGCGKTTLLRLVAGLEKPDSGSVLLESRDITGMPPHKRQFGMMFQELALFPHKSVFENVAYGLRMLRQFPAQILERTEEMLALVGLSNMARRDVGELSGGEQQRVALARALVHEPDLIPADEPTGNLDPETGGRVLDLLDGLVREDGRTLLAVTHSRELADRADRVFQLDHGRVLESLPA
jgi:ABC-type Fe3+/spermidine/putrescine transport system ATPase subunit